MLTVEAALYKALVDKGITPDVTAGLSLGEYGALIASGAMTMEDAFGVVRKRGIYMQEAVPTGGAMTAVLGLDPEKIEEICKETAQKESAVVSIANYNCPGQIVITGQKDAVDKAAAACSEAGAKRAVPLKVSGPFHSKMLEGAGEKLGEALKDVEIHDIKVPYITNVTADYVASKDDVKDYLKRQVSSSVRWQQTIERLIADGADEFIEIGPGRSLAGFMRKINRDVKVVNIDKLEDFESMLTGKVALVTGAGRGIGRQIALTLAAQNAFVIVNYNGSKDKAEETVSEIKAAGGDAVSYKCNVSDFEECQQMITAIIKEYKHIDILVNNAGITRDGLIMKMSEDDYDAVLDTNLKGTFNTIRHMSRYFLKQKSGRIINISSVSGILGNAGQANYSASKAGVIGLTKAVARELASRGITVNAVAPGFVDTDMTDALSDSAKENLISQIPLGRTGKPQDIANAVLFLASDAAGYITGQVLSVDGGMAI